MGCTLVQHGSNKKIKVFLAFFCSCKSKGRGTERYGMDIPLLGDSFTPGDIFQRIFFTELQEEVLLCCYFFFSHGNCQILLLIPMLYCFSLGRIYKEFRFKVLPLKLLPIGEDIFIKTVLKLVWSWDVQRLNSFCDKVMLLVSEVYRTTENEPVFEDRFRIDYEMFSIVLFEEKPSTSLRNNNITFRIFSVSWDWENQLELAKHQLHDWLNRCMMSTYTQLVINFQVSTKKGQDKPTHRSLSAELQGSRRSSPSISRASHGGALMQLTKGDADDSRIHRFIWASSRNCVICRLQWRGIVVFFLAFCEGFSIPFPKPRSGCSANSSRCGLAGRLLRQSLTDQWFP